MARARIDLALCAVVLAATTSCSASDAGSAARIRAVPSSSSSSSPETDQQKITDPTPPPTWDSALPDPKPDRSTDRLVRTLVRQWTAADTGHFKVSYVSGVNGSTIQTEGDYALSSRRARYTWTAKAGGSTFEADYVVDGHRSYGRSDLLSGFGDGCWLVVEDDFPQGKVPFYPTVQPAEFPANLEAFGSLHGVGQRQGVMIASATLTEVAKLFIATEEAYLVGVAARAGTNPVVDVRVGAARAGVAWGTTGTELIESIERATHPLGPDRRGSLSGAAAAEYTRIGERVHISVPPLVMQHTQWMRRPSKACI